MTLRMLVHVVVLLAAAAVSPARSAALQAPLTVEGRVIGPDGAPQADQVMMLHRVDRSGGATIAETSSGADGSYVLTAPASTDTSAVYFVAARYDGDLYIGAPFRQGQPDRLAQLIQVGVAANSATALMNADAPAPPVAGRPATGRSWLLLLVPLLGAAGVGLYVLTGRSRISPDRKLLLRVAELDERMLTAPHAHGQTLQQERDQLMTQLRALP